MTKTKILYLITKSSWGGAQRYVFDLATTIDKERYEPVIALGGTGELYDALRAAGLKVISIKGLQRDVSAINDLMAAFDIARIIWKERPDVLHINSSKVGVLGTLLGRLLRIRKIIFTAHGWAFNENRPLWQKRLIKLLQWFSVVLSHVTIVVSHGLAQDFDWPLVARKFTLVHLGRTVGALKPREEARGIISMKVTDNVVSLYDHADDFWIGTIAELHPTKCIDVAITALASLVKDFPTVRYIIMHDGEERERLRALVARLNLQEHVFFTGTVPDAAKLLPAFDLFVLPSRSEAFGYVLIEAGLAGVPVIASRVGGIPDIITNEQTGLLVPPENPTALGEAMRRVLTNETLRANLAEAHRANAATFSLAAMIQKTEAVYRE